MTQIQPDLSQVPPTIAPTFKEMMSVRTDGGKTVVKINSSSLNILQTCPRKAQYDLIEGWKPKTSAPATVFGTAIHAALEEFYRGTKLERQLPEGWRKQTELMAYGQTFENENDFLLYRATREFIDKAAPLADLPESDKRSIPSGVWTLQHYFDTYINDPYTIWKDPSDGQPFVERMLEAVLFDSPTLEVRFFGTIDCILENTATSEILVTDHKTSSIVGKDFYNRLKPNHQYTAYLWLAQETLGLPVDKFMVNCIQVKPRPKTSRGAPPHFPRQITTRDARDVEEFKAIVVNYVREFLYHRAQDFFPMGSVDACANYGACKYLEVCSSPYNLRNTLLENKYVKTQ